MIRKILHIGLISIGVLLILLAGAMIFASLSPGERMIKGMLESKLSDLAGLDVSIGNFETNLFSRIQVRDLIVAKDLGSAVDTVIRITHITAEYSVFDLLKSTPLIHSVMVDSLFATISRDSAGTFGIPIIDKVDTASAALADSGATGMGIAVDSIAIGNINITLVDVALLFGAQVVNLSAHAQRTPANQYSFAVSIDTIGVSYDSLPIDITPVTLAGIWDEQALVMDSLTASIEDIALRAHARIRTGDTSSLFSEIEMTGRPSRLVQKLQGYFDLPPLEITDSLHITIVTGGTVNAPTIQAKGEFPRLTMQEIAVDQAAFSIEYANGIVTVDSLSFGCLGGEISGSGTFAIEPQINANLLFDYHGLSLGEIYAGIHKEKSPYAGKVGGNIRIQGDSSDVLAWQTSGSMDMTGVTYTGRAIPDFDLEFDVKHGRGNLTFRQGESSGRAELSFTDSLLRGMFDISIPDITPLAGLSGIDGISGSVKASGDISGTFDNPSLAASVTGHDFAYNHFPVDSVHAVVRYRDSALIIDDFNAAGKYASTESATAPFDLDSLRGRFSYTATVAGTMENLKGNIAASFEDLFYGSYGADSGVMNLAMNGMEVTAEKAVIFFDNYLLQTQASFDMDSLKGNAVTRLNQLPADSVTWRELGYITSQFTLGPDSQIVLEAEGRRFQIDALSHILPDTIEISGILDFDMTFRGDLRHPQGRLSAQIIEFRAMQAVFDTVTASVRLDDRTLTVNEVAIHTGGHEINSHASLELQRDRQGSLTVSDSSVITGELTISDFDLAPLTATVGQFKELSGILSTDLAWHGTIGRPHVDGTLSYIGGRFAYDSSSVPMESVQARILIRDTLLILDDLSLTVDKTPVLFRGELRHSDWQRFVIALSGTLGKMGTFRADGLVDRDTLDLTVTTDDFNLGILAAAFPDIDSLKGTLLCRLDITGSMKSPILIGTLEMDSLSATLPAMYTKISNGLIRLSFDKSSVKIDSLVARVNGGTSAISGYITHDFETITDLSLVIRADSVSFSMPDTLTLKLTSAALIYKKENDYYSLTGDIRLGETRLVAGLRPQSILPWARSVEVIEYEYPEIIRQTRFDIRIRESNDLWVDNNLARIKLHAELGIIGNPVQPNFTGMISIDEGYLLYLDRRFAVTRGTVFFSDPVRFNPDIALTAQTQVSSFQRLQATKYTITINAEGLLDQLQVSLESDPPLDQSDIIALLTLGATRGQLTNSGSESGEGGAKSALLNRAAMLSSQRISGYVSNKVGSLFGFSEFTVQGNLFNFGDSWGPQLLASRKLSDRVEITYTTTVGRLNDQNIRLGYRLTSRFSLQGQTDRYGQSLIDFKYGFKFK